MAEVKVNIDDTSIILENRGLGENGRVRKFFTHEVRRLSDKYVPFRLGDLKNTAIEKTSEIQYVQPYARRQWYEHRGKGLRGSHWCTRMFADRGNEIISSVVRFAEAKK